MWFFCRMCGMVTKGSFDMLEAKHCKGATWLPILSEKIRKMQHFSATADE